MATHNPMDVLAALMGGQGEAVPLQNALATFGKKTDLNDAYFSDGYNTKLSPKEEQAYQQWAVSNNRQQDTNDYDMRGAWKGNVGQSGNGHYPDTFKKPNHPTFSDQSIYHNAANPNGGQFVGGNWVDAPQGKFSFTPSLEMVRQPGYVNFMRDKYMPETEPGNTFNMDRK